MSIARRMPVAALLLLTACVTINVYFPAAAAEKAAQRFIDDVWGTEGAPQPEPVQPQGGSGGGGGLLMLALDFVVPPAQAQQADITISSPAIDRIKTRMEGRFKDSLSKYFDSGAIGLTGDALVAVRDLAAVPLNERNQVKQLVSEENADRNAVYREIAVANGHAEWEDQIRDTFAQQWIAKAPQGWYYQKNGAWQQK